MQLGYTWYGKEFQRTGLNKQCKLLLLEFAFETLGLDRVEFRADANNARKHSRNEKHRLYRGRYFAKQLRGPKRKAG